MPLGLDCQRSACLLRRSVHIRSKGTERRSPPWRKLSNFSIRAETASIDDAEGATSDTQPVRVALTVRYSIFPDRVAEVFEKYSHILPVLHGSD